MARYSLRHVLSELQAKPSVLSGSGAPADSTDISVQRAPNGKALYAQIDATPNKLWFKQESGDWTEVGDGAGGGGGMTLLPWVMTPSEQPLTLQQLGDNEEYAVDLDGNTMSKVVPDGEQKDGFACFEGVIKAGKRWVVVNPDLSGLPLQAGSTTHVAIGRSLADFISGTGDRCSVVAGDDGLLVAFVPAAGAPTDATIDADHTGAFLLGFDFLANTLSVVTATTSAIDVCPLPSDFGLVAFGFAGMNRDGELPVTVTIDVSVDAAQTYGITVPAGFTQLTGGSLECPLPAGAAAGALYEVTQAGQYSGDKFAVGDLALIHLDGTTATHIPVTNSIMDWSIVRTLSPVAIGASVNASIDDADISDVRMSVVSFETPKAYFETTPAVSAGAGVQWLEMVASNSQAINEIVTAFTNANAVLGDVIDSMQNWGLQGSCTSLMLIKMAPGNAGKLTTVSFTPDDRSENDAYLNENLLEGHAIYIGLNTETGTVVVEPGFNDSFDVEYGPEGPATVGASALVEGFKIVAFMEGISPIDYQYPETPLGPYDLTMRLGFEVNAEGKLPLRAAGAIVPPEGVADGRRYKVIGSGNYLGTALSNGDVVEFMDGMTKLLKHGGGGGSGLKKWDVAAGVVLEAASATETFGTGQITDEGRLKRLSPIALVGGNTAYLQTGGGIDVSSQSFASADLIFPDVNRDNDTYFRDLTIGFINDAASVEDFFLALNGAQNISEGRAFIVELRAGQYKSTAYDLAGQTDDILQSGSFPSPLVSGDKITLEASNGEMAIRVNDSDYYYLGTMPEKLNGQSWRLFVSEKFYSGAEDYASTPFLSFGFNISGVASPFVGTNIPVPSGANAGDMFEATSGGNVGAATIATGDIAVVKSDGKSLAIIRKNTPLDAAEKGGSLSQFSNAPMPYGYATGTDIGQAIQDHKNSQTGHNLVGQYSPGFMSVADKTALDSLGYAQANSKWFPTNTTATLSGVYLDSLAYSPDLDILVAARKRSGSGEVMSYSTDGGATWEKPTVGVGSSPETTVFWIPELKKFIAFAGTGESRVYTSTDGIIWVSSYGFSYGFSHVDVGGFCYSPELGLAVAAAYRSASVFAVAVASAANLASWTQVDTPRVSGTQGLRAVAWSSDLRMFVALPYASESPVVYSYDGWTWEASPVACPFGYWVSVQWIPELAMFVAVGNTAGYTPITMHSRDGKVWIPATAAVMANSTAGNRLEWCPEIGVMVVVGQYGAMWSTNGVAWTTKSSDGTTFAGAGRTACWMARRNSLVMGDGLTQRTLNAPVLGIGTQGMAKTAATGNSITLSGTRTLLAGDSNTTLIVLSGDLDLSLPVAADVGSFKTGHTIRFAMLPTQKLHVSSGDSGCLVQAGPAEAYATGAFLTKVNEYEWNLSFVKAGRGTTVAISSVSSELVIDPSVSEFINLSIGAPITDISFINLPESYEEVVKVTVWMTQSASPGAVTWPASFRWSGAAPTMPTSVGDVAVLELIRGPDGSTWDATFTVRG